MEGVPLSDWSFEPGEAIDAIVFCNAASEDSFYAAHHPGLRERWAPALGEAGLRAIDQGRDPSMSALSYLLDAVGVRTLDEVVDVLSGLPASGARIEAALGANGADRVRAWGSVISALRARGTDAAQPWRHLKRAGFADHWRREVLPGLERGAQRLRAMMAGHPLEPIAGALNAFLGESRPLCGSRIVLVRYIAPISFVLPRGAMALQPDHAPDPTKLTCLCVHESLHGFPGSTGAQEAQRRMIAARPDFAGAYEAWRERAQTGDEENLVTGAEAYLTECLGARTARDCVTYLRQQNGGMPLAASVYACLREERPDRSPAWPGFGPWAAQALESGRIVPHWPAAMEPM